MGCSFILVLLFNRADYLRTRGQIYSEIIRYSYLRTEGGLRRSPLYLRGKNSLLIG